MPLFKRFTIRTILWLTVILAVGLSWLADRTRLQRSLDQMVRYDEMRQKRVEELEAQMRYAQKVHTKLYTDHNWVIDELREKGSLKYDDIFPTTKRRIH